MTPGRAVVNRTKNRPVGYAHRPTCRRCNAPMLLDQDEWTCLNCDSAAKPAAAPPRVETRDPYDQLIGECERLAAWLVMRIARLGDINQNPKRRTPQTLAELQLRRGQLRRLASALRWLKQPHDIKGKPRGFSDGTSFICPEGHHVRSKAHRACIAARKDAAS